MKERQSLCMMFSYLWLLLFLVFLQFCQIKTVYQFISFSMLFTNSGRQSILMISLLEIINKQSLIPSYRSINNKTKQTKKKWGEGSEFSVLLLWLGTQIFRMTLWTRWISSFCEYSLFSNNINEEIMPVEQKIISGW